MLTATVRENYRLILKGELVPALGCTEPIAIAFAAARARAVLGKLPDRCDVWCSGNIIKNVRNVTVPNTGGLKGIEAAVAAGIVAGDASRELQVLEGMDAAEIAVVRRLIADGFCSTRLAEGVENLYILVRVHADADQAEVCIRNEHTNITRITRNGAVLFEKDGTEPGTASCGDRSLLNVRDILEFAATENLTGGLGALLSSEVRINGAIADEGLRNHYGADVGKTLLKCFGSDVRTRARARAAAGSDARMSGCSLPVIINSGSGNQGMTVSLPVIEYAREFDASEERLCRALIVSNLVAIHQKRFIGRLSAYCGAVSAACGSGAAITWLAGGDYGAVSRTIVNTIANVGGLVCDGAKPSCAAKIASAVDAAIMGCALSAEGKVFGSGEGLVKDTVEDTIRSIGRMGSVGMKDTDTEILRIMTGT